MQDDPPKLYRTPSRRYPSMTSFLGKNRPSGDQNKRLLDMLEGEQLIPDYQFFNAYYIQSGKKEEVIITITNYRIFIKSLEYGETIWVPFMMIDHMRREVDMLVMVCKDVRTIVLLIGNHTEFSPEKDACTIFYEKLKELTAPQTIEESFAHQYKMAFSQKDIGWDLYNPVKYFENLVKPQDKEPPTWCISTVNNNYEISSTYPSCLVVPFAARDEESLRRVGQFRSKGRIPCMCWKHPSKPITISRCSQPKVGLVLNSSQADKSLIDGIRNTNNLSSVLYFVDARPKVSAIGNVLGPSQGGYEYGYRNTQLFFLNIENIHVMRDSWVGLCNLVYKSMLPNFDDSKWAADLVDTGWLTHIKTLLIGAIEIVRIIEKYNSSVVIHCSDGWDRTAQLSSLAQLLIDPFFRTIEGFAILIEKEWCSFGHKFAQRVGHERNDSKKKKRTERSPIFIQWLDSVWQIQAQFPDSFEFNEEFLICVADALYDCKFGTFLENNEKERKACQTQTVSLWSWTNLEENKIIFTNPLFEQEKNVLWPSCSYKNIKLWENYWLRWDPEYTQKFLSPMVQKAIAKNTELNKTEPQISQV